MVWLKSGPLVRGVLLRKEKPPNRTKNGLLIRVLVRLEQNKINDLALVLVHCLVRGPSGPDPRFSAGFRGFAWTKTKSMT